VCSSDLYRRTEIDLHEVTADQLAVPRAVVRNRRILPCSHDRLESHGLRTMVEHAALQLTSHLALGAAFPQSTGCHQASQGAVRHRPRSPDQVDLRFVLHCSKPLDNAWGAGQRRLTCCRSQRVALFDTDVLALETESAVSCEVISRIRSECLGTTPFDEQLEVRDLVA